MCILYINMRIVPNLRPLSGREVYFTVHCPRIGSRILKTHIISWREIWTWIDPRSILVSNTVIIYHARHAWKRDDPDFERIRDIALCWTAASDTIADFNSFCIIFVLFLYYLYDEVRFSSVALLFEHIKMRIAWILSVFNK